MSKIKDEVISPYELWLEEDQPIGTLNLALKSSL